MSAPRVAWRAAYRAARIFRKHRIAGLAEASKLPREADALLAKAIRCRPAPAYLFALEAARRASRAGYSFRHAIRQSRRALDYRYGCRLAGDFGSDHYSPRNLP